MVSALMATYSRLPVTFEKGEGVWLWDTNGNRYLDALSGVAVCSLGHAHPAIAEAICKQASTLVHTSNIYGIANQQALGEALTTLSGMDRVFFGKSGAEANEAAIKKGEKAKEISDGKINDFGLRLFVAFGVAIGIALGSFRIVDGGHIVYYIIAGYIVVIALTVIAPKYIIGIAYDSGGVTTSTVTVPLVAALGLGLASNIPGRDPLVDGFGLIAFASLFPMITVMLYGVISDKLGIKGEQEKEEEQLFELRQAIEDAQDMGLATVNVDGFGQRHSYQAHFSAVYIIVPKEKREKALRVAREAGATGVTVTQAHGMGLQHNEEQFYNRLEQENTDVKLMFLMPTKLVNNVIRQAMDELDIVGDGHGVIYAYPLSHIKGITIKREHL